MVSRGYTVVDMKQTTMQGGSGHMITVERHDEAHTVIVERMTDGTEHHVARLATFHHEAATWADVVTGHAVVYRPRDYDGCPCNRCKQGWTASEGRHDDRELPGDRL